MASDSNSCSSCSDTSCSARNRQSNENPEEFLERQKLESNLCRIKNKIFVLSGKGGVGKSTIAVNLAVFLAGALKEEGKKVGLLDLDMHGPSIPTMVGMENFRPGGTEDGRIIPAEKDNLKILSVGFFLEAIHKAVVWRGPMKSSVIQQFVKDVEWGDLEYLIIDLPPGTGDEALSAAQIMQGIDGALVVTTPQKVALRDVSKSLSFCETMKIPVIGILENMSGFACPRCGEVTNLFETGGGSYLSKEMNVPFLGRIPLDLEVRNAGDLGEPYLSRNNPGPIRELLEEAFASVLSWKKQTI